ncbi:MAG: hypothetical protein D6737_11890 [Chloroflexi bacterium]|nr:MAG: hypothetical protein D6737_11890 [Chloroflexota bacterium]
MLAFGMAASVMVTFMFGLSFVVVSARDSIITLVRTHLTDIKTWSGVIIVLVGVGFIVQALFARQIDALLPFR